MQALYGQALLHGRHPPRALSTGDSARGLETGYECWVVFCSALIFSTFAVLAGPSHCGFMSPNWSSLPCTRHGLPSESLQRPESCCVLPSWK